jgi:ribosomal protein L18E
MSKSKFRDKNQNFKRKASKFAKQSRRNQRYNEVDIKEINRRARNGESLIDDDDDYGDYDFS